MDHQVAIKALISDMGNALINITFPNALIQGQMCACALLKVEQIIASLGMNRNGMGGTRA